jgi:ATP-dependent helicase/nuclease subunit B
MYLSSNISLIEVDDYLDIDTVMQQASNGIERTGILLNEKDILYAMNHELDTAFLAGIKKDKAQNLKGEALADSQTFADIYEKIEKVIVKFAGELYAGKADATPLRNGKSIPCTYCEAKPICRKINTMGGDR